VLQNSNKYLPFLLLLLTVIGISIISIGRASAISSTGWTVSGQNTYFDGTGSVGIGTTNPGYDLTFGSSGQVLAFENSTALVAKNTSGVYENFFWPRESNNGTYMQYGSGGMYIMNNSSQNVLTLNNSKNVGIGTDTPMYKLSIGGGASVFGVDNTASFAAKNTGGAYESYFWPRESNNAMYMQAGSGGFYLRNSNAQNKVIIDSQNNICIGNC
jgi:K+-transporting ATPase c subunit